VKEYLLIVRVAHGPHSDLIVLNCFYFSVYLLLGPRGP